MNQKTIEDINHILAFQQRTRVSPAILHLLMHDGQRVSEFRNKVKCSTANVAHLRKTLDKEGLGHMVVDPENARFRIIKITAKGLRLLNDFYSSVDPSNTPTLQPNGV